MLKTLPYLRGFDWTPITPCFFWTNLPVSPAPWRQTGKNYGKSTRLYLNCNSLITMVSPPFVITFANILPDMMETLKHPVSMVKIINHPSGNPSLLDGPRLKGQPFVFGVLNPKRLSYPMATINKRTMTMMIQYGTVFVHICSRFWGLCIALPKTTQRQHLPWLKSYNS